MKLRCIPENISSCFGQNADKSTSRLVTLMVSTPSQEFPATQGRETVHLFSMRSIRLSSYIHGYYSLNGGNLLLYEMFTMWDVQLDCTLAMSETRI